MPKIMSTRKMVASGVVAALALGVGLWRANSGAGTHSVLVGSLRVVTADAQTTGSVITEQQALSTILSKITQMEPGVAWPTSAAPQTAPGISLPGGWSMEEVSGVTQVYDNVTGKLLYRRTWPISAWVAQYHSALGTYGFGMVSDGANLPTCFNERTCEPPGQLLVAQAFVEPGGLTPQCTAPASNPQQYIQCETK